MIQKKDKLCQRLNPGAVFIWERTIYSDTFCIVNAFSDAFETLIILILRFPSRPTKPFDMPIWAKCRTRSMGPALILRTCVISFPFAHFPTTFTESFCFHANVLMKSVGFTRIDVILWPSPKVAK
jgi:hypothetical protein